MIDEAEGTRLLKMRSNLINQKYHRLPWVMKDKTRSKSGRNGVHKGDEGQNEVKKWEKGRS